MKKLIALFSFINIFIGGSFCMEEREKPRSKAEQRELDSQLFDAIESDDINLLRTLLEKGANPNARSKIGNNTALIIAVRYNNYPIAELLLSHGATLNAQNSIGNTALFIAVLHNRQDIAQLLLERGANPTLTNIRGESAWSIASDEFRQFIQEQFKGPLKRIR